MRPPILPVPLDLADEAIARAVLELQRESYAVEAGLIGDDRIPPLTETLEELREAGLEWLGASDEAGLTGAVAWKSLRRRDRGHPSAGRGPAGVPARRRDALLDELDARYPGRRVLVSTGRDERPGA